MWNVLNQTHSRDTDHNGQLHQAPADPLTIPKRAISSDNKANIIRHYIRYKNLTKLHKHILFHEAG